MLWRVGKGGRTSWLVGTAHISPCSFQGSLAGIIGPAEHVLCEGPLDRTNMAKVVRAGTDPDYRSPLLTDLDRRTLDRIARRTGLLRCRTAALDLLGAELMAEVIRNLKPWLAFFNLWFRYLSREGWEFSVDRQAWETAERLGKNLVSLETIEEQIQVLESLSYDHIKAFLKRVDDWPVFAESYAKWYLKGDLARIKANPNGFPTRKPIVINPRDGTLLERMRPFLEDGRAVVCLGAPHMWGIVRMLREEGYAVEGPPVP